jgi:hypothetical protein
MTEVTVASVPIRLVRVSANGKRFIFLNEHRDIVQCKGEIVRLSGSSASHGPDKRFKRDRVEIQDLDMTEELMQELCLQDGGENVEEKLG